MCFRDQINMCHICNVPSLNRIGCHQALNASMAENICAAHIRRFRYTATRANRFILMGWKRKFSSLDNFDKHSSISHILLTFKHWFEFCFDVIVICPILCLIYIKSNLVLWIKPRQKIIEQPARASVNYIEIEKLKVHALQHHDNRESLDNENNTG
jgi:hypothetical protein